MGEKSESECAQDTACKWNKKKTKCYKNPKAPKPEAEWDFSEPAEVQPAQQQAPIKTAAPESSGNWLENVFKPRQAGGSRKSSRKGRRSSKKRSLSRETRYKRHSRSRHSKSHTKKSSKKHSHHHHRMHHALKAKKYHTMKRHSKSHTKKSSHSKKHHKKHHAEKYGY
jgi:hypothetical protein